MQVSLEPSGSVTATGVKRLGLETYIGLIYVCAVCVCVRVLYVHGSEYVKNVDNGTAVGSLDGLE